MLPAAAHRLQAAEQHMQELRLPEDSHHRLQQLDLHTHSLDVHHMLGQEHRMEQVLQTLGHLHRQAGVLGSDHSHHLQGWKHVQESQVSRQSNVAPDCKPGKNCEPALLEQHDMMS
jgi:hypothetical protein